MPVETELEIREERTFSQLARAYSREDCKPGFHAMLECYFDDSSDPRRERLCVSGGLIGSVEQWDVFMMAWSDAVHNLSKPFRSTECECGHGQFESWPIQRRIELMSRLVGVVQQTSLAGFASVVPASAFREAFPGRKEEDAYLLTIPHAIMNAAVIADKMNEDAHVWFESGEKDGAILNYFKSVKKMTWSPAGRLRDITFGTKRNYSLQAADLVAREAFKHVDNRGMRPTRKPIKRIGKMACFILWTDQALQYLAKNGGTENLELMARWDERADAPRFEHFWKNF